MAFITNNYLLTALEPIKLTYKYNEAEEKLSGETYSYSNGFRYVQHDALSGYKDAAFSRNSCLLLTDVKSLKQTFKVNTKKQYNFLGQELTNNSFYLKTEKGQYVCVYRNKFYVGGIGKKALFSLIVISPNIVELKISNSHCVLVEQTYPYELYASEEYIDSTEKHKKRFEIDYFQGTLSLKSYTQDGARFLNVGLDKQLRATGTNFNNALNTYYFFPEFIGITADEMRYETQHITTEVNYFNEINGQREKEHLYVEEYKENDTNLLISCTTLDLSKNATALANIAILKSNYDTTGVYTTK